MAIGNYAYKRKIEEVKVDPSFGLNDDDVEYRKKLKLTNKTKKVVGKTYPQIIFTNLFSFFNILLFIIAALLIIGEMYTSLAFVVVYLANIVIGLYSDIKAHHLLNKLKLISDPVVNVVRNGVTLEIKTDDIVLDDVISLKSSNQIVCDSIVLEGEIGVNESLLTGESLVVYKKPGDFVYSGTYVVSGKALVKADRVGKDNYVNHLQNSAKLKKKPKTPIKRDLDNLFLVIGTIVIIVATCTFVTEWSDLQNNFQKTIGPIAGSLIAMIPAGLYLLTSLAITFGTLKLARKMTLVQESYSLEMLARSTVLCLDKTGTITDGTMDVTKIINYGVYEEHELSMIAVNVIRANEDDNLTAKAILKAYPYELTDVVKAKLPFDSKNKYSAATFSSGTFILGALEVMDVANKKQLEEEIDPYLDQGLRVLAIAKSSGKIKDGKVDGTVKVLGFIILQDHIRETAKETFKWFKDNGVKIRVISGDNARSVSIIAKQAGVDDAEKYLSLAGLSDEEIRERANDYTVFGRVTPEQKELLVTIFKENGETVAMTGDGVNDILALRKADCSIAVLSGSEAARNVSQLVLLNDDFASLPSVVAEGRRVVNNLQRTSSLFLTKTIFAIVLSFAFLISSWCGHDGYPFVTNHLYLWEMTAIGLGAFLVAIEPNAETIKGKFLTNILSNAIPSGIMMILSVLIMYCFMWGNAGIYSVDEIVVCCGIMFAILPLANFYVICSPFSKYRMFVFALLIAVNAATIGTQWYLSANGITNEPLKLDFSLLNPYQLTLPFVIGTILSGVYVTYNDILIKVKKLSKIYKDKKKEKDGGRYFNGN